MTSSQVQSIIDAIKSASPALYAAARHQVAAQVAQDWFWIWLFAALGIACLLGVAFGLWLQFVKPHPSRSSGAFSDDYIAGGFTAIVFAVLLLVCIILVAVNVNDLIQKTQAPDYAIVQNLANLLPSSGGS